MQLSDLTDRQLLEQIYLLLLKINGQVDENSNDAKQLVINTMANLIADRIAFNK